jgi:hypothetical protein
VASRFITINGANGDFTRSTSGQRLYGFLPQSKTIARIAVSDWLRSDEVVESVTVIGASADLPTFSLEILDARPIPVPVAATVTGGPFYSTGTTTLTITAPAPLNTGNMLMLKSQVLADNLALYSVVVGLA